MSSETLVAGIDSSTQSTKVLLVRAEDGVVVDEATAPHPQGTSVDPRAWWEALQQAGAGLLERASAISVGGQQHGMVALDASGECVRDALLWNDLRSAPQAASVVDYFGGAQATATAIGSVPTASMTVTKLRWMLENEPDNAARTAAVLLPHDFLTWMLAGRGEFTTDHGDASGTGYYSPASRSWLPEVAAWAVGHDVALPRIVAPGAVAQRTASGTILGAGTGDNMAAALGLSLQDGDVVVSIGTSGTAFCMATQPSADPSGMTSGFADATGNYLPLACTINASKILDSTARLLGADRETFADLALAAAPGAGGLTYLPYLDGERTPNRPTATGVMHGLTSGVQREDLARAAVEGLLCSLADAIDALGVTPSRVLMIGGGSRNRAVQQLAPAVFGMPVVVPAAGEYVALGAARQAAWALAGTQEPPAWSAAESLEFTADPTPQVRDKYNSLRDATEGW
ncbi:xylulokinase [Nakamurella antarctica]|uniref:Xylulose kinase n=1 Tax=Nakamurella antarctica TaxID=1902245 RepID=A0A3G8ZPD0_9ACTN|nr:xylulokinase [Nakamurella antarctica]AZI59130.1 xylulokinase [Nakamurella antarctica]